MSPTLQMGYSNRTVDKQNSNRLLGKRSTQIFFPNHQIENGTGDCSQEIAYLVISEIRVEAIFLDCFNNWLKI